MATKTSGSGRRVLAIAISLVLLGLQAPAQKLEGADTALVRLDRPGGATIGLRLETGMREFTYREDVLEVDLLHVLARAGGNLAPFLNLWGEAGWMRAETEPDETGEGGLEWGVGADVKILEYVIKSSPVVDRKEAFSVGLTLAYRGLGSNFDDRDFEWNEFRVNPAIAYTRDLAGEIRRPYQPSAVAARVGVLYLNAEGDYGADKVEENRDFAFTCGFDLLGESGWVTRIGVVLFGTQEREFSLAAMYHF